MNRRQPEQSFLDFIQGKYPDKETGYCFPHLAQSNGWRFEYLVFKFQEWIKIQNGDFESIALNNQDIRKLEVFRQSGVKRVMQKVLIDAVNALTFSGKNPNAEIDTRNPYNTIAHFLGNEEVFPHITPSQAKHLIATLKDWSTWVNMTLPFQERFNSVLSGK